MHPPGNKHVTLESPLQTTSKEELKDVRCVICQEPPHNAVLLFCCSYSDGCRTYMCDTSAGHSNCFKQFKKHNKSRLNPKPLSCPHCRGDVLETVKVMTSARRFMNAKPRSCSFEGCEFNGSYSQLKNHLKDEHVRYKMLPSMNLIEEWSWEEMQEDVGFSEFRAAIWTRQERIRGESVSPYEN